MNIQLPIKRISRTIGESLQRIQQYIALNHKSSSQLKRTSFQKSQQLITLIGNAFLTSKTANFELTPYVANSVLQVVQQHLALVGLYQEEQNIIQQLMINIVERQQLTEKIEQKIEELVNSKYQKDSCSETKELMYQEPLKGGNKSYSAISEKEKTQTSGDDLEYGKRTKQEEVDDDCGSDEERVGLRSKAKIKEI